VAGEQTLAKNCHHDLAADRFSGPSRALREFIEAVAIVSAGAVCMGSEKRLLPRRGCRFTEGTSV